MAGRYGFAPCSRRVRAGTSLPKFAAQPRREGGSRRGGTPQPGCEVLTGARNDRMAGLRCWAAVRSTRQMDNSVRTCLKTENSIQRQTLRPPQFDRRTAF
jgi:hypothetical protein